jgi:hypothetical protein
MREFNVPPQAQSLDLSGSDPSTLFPLVIGILGEEAAKAADTSTEVAESSTRLVADDPFALHFAATFLHAYVLARQDSPIAAELLLLSAGAYYLCDLAGSAAVLSREAFAARSETDNWTVLLRWVIAAQWNDVPALADGQFSGPQITIRDSIVRYFATGDDRAVTLAACESLTELAYHEGTPRELLIVDVIVGIVKKRIVNSVRQTLPAYSGLSAQDWEPAFAKSAFIKELWPSQHLFGEHGLFQGKSAVIQMPTSAGKTRAIDLVIRSAFYSNRATVAVVVAPFRALCNEITLTLRRAFAKEPVIVNEFSDALQQDYSFRIQDENGAFIYNFAVEPSKQIIVVTPEKLLYVLRHEPSLIDSIGVIFYDEGHQFDSGRRGVVYELLITAIKRLIKPETQTVLISAVIQDAASIARWLVGEEAVVIQAPTVSSTDQNVAFASWSLQMGQLRFVAPQNPDHFDYFVPRVIKSINLSLRGKERKAQVFPKKGDSASIALYLGLQVVANGSVAIFCGQKNTAISLTKKVVEAYERKLSLAPPVNYSDADELSKLHFLISSHLGNDAEATKAAALGVFSHHRSVPHGIRLSVEYAMTQNLIKFVLCTSTLAQGVNLPIRYLIVSGTMQGQERMERKDFRNLVGRAGRAGMHTEGTILFSDHTLYDGRTNPSTRWRWQAATRLFDIPATEIGSTSLLDVLVPLQSDFGKRYVSADMAGMLLAALNDIKPIHDVLARLAIQHARAGFTAKGLHKQLSEKLRSIETLESYLMANRGTEGFEVFLASTDALARETLAFSMADDANKTDLLRLFAGVAQHIESKEPSTTIQALYGRTLLGVSVASRIREWTLANLSALAGCGGNDAELLRLLWPLIKELLTDDLFEKYLPEEAILDLALGWIENKSFADIDQSWKAAGGAKKYGEGTRATIVEDIISICENSLGFEIMLYVAAVAENLNGADVENPEILQATIARLQKRLKYGIEGADAITLYERGFADRIVAREMAGALGAPQTGTFVQRLRQNEAAIRAVLQRYPSYFMNCLNTLLQSS